MTLSLAQRKKDCFASQVDMLALKKWNIRNPDFISVRTVLIVIFFFTSLDSYHAKQMAW